MCALLAAQPTSPVVRGRQGGPAPNGDLLSVRQRQRAPERATLCHVLLALALAYAPRPASVMPTSGHLHKSKLQAPGAGHMQPRAAGTASSCFKARIKPTQQDSLAWSVLAGAEVWVRVTWGHFQTSLCAVAWLDARLHVARRQSNTHTAHVESRSTLYKGVCSREAQELVTHGVAPDDM